MRRSALTAVLAAGLLLTGCSSDVRGQIRGEVADITRDANARDAGAVRRGVDDLLALLDDAVRSGELTSAEAAEVAAAATAVRERAALLDEVEETPTPEPTEEPESESPSPAPTTQSPTPQPTTPSPQPTREPVETEEPEPVEEPDDDVVPTVVPGAVSPPPSEPAPA